MQPKSKWQNKHVKLQLGLSKADLVISYNIQLDPAWNSVLSDLFMCLTILLLSCPLMVTVASLMTVWVISWKSEKTTQPSSTSFFLSFFCFPSSLFFFDFPFSLEIAGACFKDIQNRHTHILLYVRKEASSIFQITCQILPPENPEMIAFFQPLICHSHFNTTGKSPNNTQFHLQQQASSSRKCQWYQWPGLPRHGMSPCSDSGSALDSGCSSLQTTSKHYTKAVSHATKIFECGSSSTHKL